MGFVATLETDTGEAFRLLLPQGYHGGKALLALLEGIEAWRYVPEDEAVQAWFVQAENDFVKPIYEVVEPLTKAWYCGEWDYREDDHELFQRRSPGMVLTQAEFKRTLEEVAARWGDIRQLQTSSDMLLKFFTAVVLPETWWYHPQWTVEDIQALAQTIRLASQRYATQARIHFS